MSVVTVNNLTVEFPIYSSHSLSLRNLVASRFVGGTFRKKENISVVCALDGISFEAHPGDRIGIIGTNGSGKSTLLRALAGIYPPSSGEVQIKGKISTLFGISLGVNDEMSGYENLFLNSLIFTRDYALTKRKMPEMAEFTDLGDHLSLPLKTYSDGMKIRITFSSATNMEPDILLIDEIFGAGDKNFYKKSSERIIKMIDRSSTFFLASHSNALIKEFCNKAIYLSSGKIVEYGEVEDVLSSYEEGRGDV